MNWYIKHLAGSSVNIDTSDYEESLRNALREMVEWGASENDRIKNLSFDKQKVVGLLQQFNYPNSQDIINAIDSNDPQQIAQAAWGFFKWNNQQSTESWNKMKSVPKNSKDWSDAKAQWDLSNQQFTKARELRQSLMDYAEFLEPREHFNEQEAEVKFQEISAKTKENLQNIATNIQKAISRIQNWYGSQIIVSAGTVSKESPFEPIESAVVYVGGVDGPLFSYFVSENKVDIDDVAEAGDEDSFGNSKVQSDYFNLIKEIRNPGSTGKGGKIVTVYTARPTKDRSLYEGSQSIPSNIFVTTRYDSAEGIARDLGSNEVRDVWKIRIDSRYLVNTLDMPGEKQYQVVGDGQVPIISIQLISLGS